MNLRTLTAMVGLGLLTGCGAHAELNFTDVSAKRLEDGRVEVTATVECVLVGVPDCEALTDHCVTAEWFPAEGLTTNTGKEVELPARGETVDMHGEYAQLGSPNFMAQTCNSRRMKEGETDTLVVTSPGPVAVEPELVIRVTTDSHGGLAFDLERIIVSP